MMTSNPTTSTTGRRPRRRLVRWLRRLAILCVVLGLSAGVGWWVLTSSWFIIGRVEPTLERLLGGEVAIRDAVYDGDGLFLLEDVVVRVRGLAGPSGQVCRIERARVVLDMSHLLRGKVRVKFVEVSEALLRLSEDSQAAGVFNFKGLTPDWSADDDSAEFLPPRVRINRTVIEVGVHDGDQYRMRGSRALSGSMQPAVGQDGWYRLTLVEVDEGGEVVADEGILVDGRWNVRTNENSMRLAAVELGPRTYVMCPQIARLWWDRMELAGRVSGVEMRWSADVGVAVEFLVEEVGLTLPIETTGLWARYRDGRIESSRSRPRMHVRSGAIKLTGDTVSLENLEGELVSADTEEDVVGVPYRVSVDIEQIPELAWERRTEWMEDVLATAPFRMRFRTDDFRVSRAENAAPPAVELPLAVARVLEKFRFGDWVLSTAVEVTREAGSGGVAGSRSAAEIRSRGQAYITNATGTYQRFPYPLDNVDSYIEFDNDKVDIHYLNGTGSNGAKVHLTGTIAPPTREGAVALRLTANDIPVDDRLRGAMNEGQQRVFDALLHRPAFEAVSEAGLVNDAEKIAALKSELVTRRREAAAERFRLNAIGPDEEPTKRRDLARAEASIERGANIVDAGPFELGGAVDLDLRIDRPAGPDQRTLTTGRVGLQTLGVVFEHFPYPFSILGGEIEWREDKVLVVVPEGGEGLPIVTSGGGRGWLRGEIDLMPPVDEGDTPAPGGPRSVRLNPDIVVTIAGDVPSEALYAAIPPTAAERPDGVLPEGWPGRLQTRGARWLKDLAVVGAIEYTARIREDSGGALGYEVDVELSDGRASPGPLIAEALGLDGGLTEEGWRLEACTGRIALRRDAITLERFEGRFGPEGGRGRVEVDGRMDFDAAGGGLGLNVRAEDFVIGPHLLGLMSTDQSEPADEFWNRYRPQGTFDAMLRYRQHAGELQERTLSIEPHDVQLNLGEELVELSRLDGELVIDADGLHVRDLVVRTASGQRDDGMIILRGLVPLAAGGGELALEGNWNRGNLESPLIEEALRISGAEDLVTRYRAHRPEGAFDAVFNFARATTDSAPRFVLGLRPDTLAFQFDGTPIYLDLDPGAEIVFGPERIDVDKVVCRHVGETLELSGSLTTAPTWEAIINLEYNGGLMRNQFSVLLPGDVRRVLESIELEEGGESELRNGRLRITEAVASDELASWNVDFDGQIVVQDASFRAGVRFQEVTGPFDIKVRRGPDRRPTVEVLARPEHLDLFGQKLRNLEATLVTSDDGRHLLLRDFRAEAGTGVITAEATIGLASVLDYELSLQLAGVPLGEFRLKGPKGGATPEPDGTAASAKARPTGLVFANLGLGGRRGESASRYGRGIARVLGGKLAEVPLALQLVTLLQFTIPSGKLDFADVKFFVAGDTLVFEEMLFESTHGDMAALRLMGEGEMDLETYELNTRFRSRSALLGISDLVGGIADRFVAIEVTGPLSDPSARIIALPGIQRPATTMVGSDPVAGEPDE